MAVKKASEGIRQLIDQTCGPDVKVSVVVDQVYAADQHETLYYRHPRGGRARFLEAPMFENYGHWIQDFADHLLLKQGTAERRWGVHVGRPLRDVVKVNAPMEFGDLRSSASLTVTAGSELVMDEPAKQHRLSKQELDARDYMRSTGVGYR